MFAEVYLIEFQPAVPSHEFRSASRLANENFRWAEAGQVRLQEVKAGNWVLAIIPAWPTPILHLRPGNGG
jgi:hypothetical protein